MSYRGHDPSSPSGVGSPPGVPGGRWSANGLADFIFHSTWDNVSSTLKIRQAGFPDCIDSEQMFIELFDTLAVRNLIPRR
jgi:hypothetical protein